MVSVHSFVLYFLLAMFFVVLAFRLKVRGRSFPSIIFLFLTMVTSVTGVTAYLTDEIVLLDTTIISNALALVLFLGVVLPLVAYRLWVSLQMTKNYVEPEKDVLGVEGGE